MQRIFLLTGALIVIIIFALQGFGSSFELPDYEAMAVAATEGETGDISRALVDVYFDVDMLGLKDVTAAGLELDFDIPSDIYLRAYGKYTDGRFGIADVIILQPRPGHEDECREILQDVKLQRMAFFKQFDVYNAYELAEDGVIFSRGGYYILLMIENSDQVREILEQHIPR